MGTLVVLRTPAMVKYSCEPDDPTKSCKARGSDLRCHFKNTREAAMALRKMDLGKAKMYLEAVLRKERCIPFHRFCGGVGRTAQAKNEKGTTGQGRWPQKSCQFLLGLLKMLRAMLRSRASMLTRFM